MNQTIENVVSETKGYAPSNESGDINNVSTINQSSQTPKVLEEEHKEKKRGRRKLLKSPAQPKATKGRAGRKPKNLDVSAPEVVDNNSALTMPNPDATSAKKANKKKTRKPKTTQYEKHPYNIQPAMTDSEKEALKHSIDSNGFDRLKPITIFKGKILDGWHRYNACLELNKKPKFVIFKGTDMDAIQYVLSSETRRHMTKSQGAAVAVESKDLITHIKEQVEINRRKNQKETNKKKAEAKAKGIELSDENSPDNNDTHKSGNLISDLFNTTRTYLPKAEKIFAADSDLHAKVKAGVLSVNAAANLLDARKAITEESVEVKTNLTNKTYSVIYIKLPCHQDKRDEIDPKMLNRMLMLKISTLANPDKATVLVHVTRDCKSHAKKVMSGWGFKLSESIIVIHEYSSYQNRYCKIKHDELLVFERNGGSPIANADSYIDSWVKEENMFDIIDTLYPPTVSKLSVFEDHNGQGWDVVNIEPVSNQMKFHEYTIAA